jgi:hypothetical protein
MVTQNEHSFALEIIGQAGMLRSEHEIRSGAAEKVLKSAVVLRVFTGRIV